MNVSEVHTQQDFRTFVQLFASEACSSDRALEEYLRALLLLVQTNKKSPVSFALLAQLLSEALSSPIAPFDTAWLRFKNPPLELSQSQPIKDDFAFLEKMLLYQIADLHLMRDEGILARPPHILWIGACRKGGRTWYNFVPTSFLSAAVEGLRADAEITTCDWSNLAILLWVGQIYE